MKYGKFTKIIIAIFLSILSGQINLAQTPRTFLLNGKLLQERKQKILDVKSPDTTYSSAISKFQKDADKSLKTEILPITSKTVNPPSGDRHDYMSQAPYFWKNPDTKDGFPYIRRDGERNPEIKQFPDHELLDKMGDAVENLSVAYYFTNKEEYAARAAEILRMWFLDEKTKMNPNLQYAQAIPGQNDGRGFGILESRSLVNVVDAIGLLENSKSWTKADQKGIEAWFTQYLKWLMTSKNGISEFTAKNNHGTFFDVQIVSYALFTGQNDLAKAILEKSKQNRIVFQLRADGSQPFELERTKSWNYSTMNLEGLTTLARLGENVGIDLWNFQTEKSGGIRKAIEFLYPYLDGKNKWKYEQIEEFKPERLYPAIRIAARKYTDENFKAIASSIPKVSNTDKDFLLD